MENTQKQIIKNIVDSLNESTRTSWTSGNLDQWTTYGRRMKDTIQSVTPILSTISTGLDEPMSKEKTYTEQDIGIAMQRVLEWMNDDCNEIKTISDLVKSHLKDE